MGSEKTEAKFSKVCYNCGSCSVNYNIYKGRRKKTFCLNPEVSLIELREVYIQDWGCNKFSEDKLFVEFRKSYEPTQIEFFHAKLMEVFHEFREEVDGEIKVEIDGMQFNDLIVKAKKLTYEKYSLV